MFLVPMQCATHISQARGLVSEKAAYRRYGRKQGEGDAAEKDDLATGGRDD